MGSRAMSDRDRLTQPRDTLDELLFVDLFPRFIAEGVEAQDIARHLRKTILADGWVRLADADLVEWCVTHDDRMVVPGECARDDYCYRYLKGLGPYPDECVSGGTVALVAFGGREQ